MLSSLDSLQVQLSSISNSYMAWSTILESMVLDLPNHGNSCNPSKISSTKWSLYYDQLCFHLLHNKYFWLLLWNYGPVWTYKAHSHLCSIQIPHKVKKWIMHLHTNYHDTTSHSRYLPWLELLGSHDIHVINEHIPQYCKTLNLPNIKHEYINTINHLEWSK